MEKVLKELSKGASKAWASIDTPMETSTMEIGKMI